MYARPPDQSRNRIKIPENYSGHTFREPSPYSDMPPPLRIDTPQNRTPTAEGVAEHPLNVTEESETLHTESEEPLRSENEAISTSASPQRPLFSSLLPPITSSEHFPFGHGIGSEEILILALMLTVYLSGNEDGNIDHELLLLLGLLLFSG
jgi:hypothetical protein